MIDLIYRPQAAADVEAVFAWYERQRRGFGSEFLDELRAAEQAIVRSPVAFRILHRDVRRCFLRRFPYQLLFTIRDDVVVIVGCFHVRRSPEAKRRRTRN